MFGHLSSRIENHDGKQLNNIIYERHTLGLVFSILQQKSQFMENTCFKSKRTTNYCWIEWEHKVKKAAPCSCFEQGISVSDCRLTHCHCGPGGTMVHNCSQKREQLNLQDCCFKLRRLTVTTKNANLSVDPTSLIAHANCQTPQDHATGQLYPNSKENWDGWLK